MEAVAKAELRREATRAGDQLLGKILELVEEYSHASEAFAMALGRTPAQARLLCLSGATSVILTVGLGLLRVLPLHMASQTIGASLESVPTVARRLAGFAIAANTNRQGEIAEVTILLRPIRHARQDLH